MADIIPFPRSPIEPGLPRCREVRVYGEESGIRVRILSTVAPPHGLWVVLDGTFEGTSTIASVPAEDMDVAELVAHSTLTTLEAAEITWSIQRIAAGGETAPQS